MTQQVFRVGADARLGDDLLQIVGQAGEDLRSPAALTADLVRLQTALLRQADQIAMLQARVLVLERARVSARVRRGWERCRTWVQTQIARLRAWRR